MCAVLRVEFGLSHRWAVLLFESVGSLRRTSLTEVRVVKFTFKFLPVVSSPFAETLIFCYEWSFIQEGKCCQVPVMSRQDDTACKWDSLGLLFVFICATVIV